jgi:large subunit ribosomal protein L29
MKEIDQFRQKSIEELQKIVLDNKEKLRQLRFDLLAGKVKNIRQIRKIRREIAVILTILNEKKKDLGRKNEN